MGRAPFSTDAAMACAWPLEAYNPETVATFRACNRSEVPTVLQRYAAHQKDPAWISRTVESLSVPALAILDMLAAHGGMLHATDLDVYADADFGIARPAVGLGLAELFRELLIVPLTTRRGRAFALVAPAADRVAAHVAGLAANAVSPSSIASSEPRDDGRNLVAVAALLAQVDLKLTQDGRPHRGAVKRIAKQIGLEETRLEHLVITAWSLGLIGELADGTVRPLPEIVAAAAEGRFPSHPVADHVASRVRAVGVVPVRTIERWMSACADRGFPTMSSARVSSLPGLVATDLSLAAAALPDASAATIAPNFEVFLPPESRLSDVARVLAVCEPVRLDRMILGRITKASIARATANGHSGDELLAMLARASRTPVPQNVSSAIRDWTTSTTHATVYTGRVIVVPPADEARVIAALPPAGAARALAPGVIAIADALPDRAMAIALEKLGIIRRSDDSSTTPRDLRGHPSPKVALPPLFEASPALRARVVAYRAGDPGEHARVRAIAPLPGPATEMTRPPPQPEIRPRNSGWGDLDDEDLDGDDDFARLDAELAVSAGTRKALEAYERRIGEELPGEAFHAFAFTIEALSMPDRRFVLGAPSFTETRERLLKLLAARSPAGPVAKSAFTELARMLGAPPPSARKEPAIEWHRDGIHARLEAAGRTHSTVLLDLGSDEPRRVAITRFTMRGSELFVLGDDQHDGSGVAIRYASIRGIADPPPSPEHQPPGRWTPLAGMTPPPGHEPCPCGSGKRYRQCCRTLPS